MTITYQIHGASCNGCLKKISNTLIHLPEVENITNIDLDSIVIKFKDYLEYIDLGKLNEAFVGSGYWLSKIPSTTNFVLVPDASIEDDMAHLTKTNLL